MHRSAASRWALPALCAGALAIAVVPILVRWSEVGPTATAFWRLALAVPVLAFWRRWDTPARTPRRHELAPFVVAGLCFAGDLAVWHWCIRLTTVANAALLPNLAPIFVTAGAWVAFGDRPGTRFLIGLAIALVGIATLVGAHAAGADDHLVGDLLGVVAAMFYAGYLLAMQRMRRHFSAATAMTWSASVSALALLLVAVIEGEPLVLHTPRGLAIVLALAWFSHVVGQGLIGWALAHLSARVSSVGLLLQPAGASVLAAWLFGEPLGWRQVVGAGLIVSGLLVVRRSDDSASDG